MDLLALVMNLQMSKSSLIGEYYSLYLGVHSFVWSVEVFRIMYDCTVNNLNAFLAHSRSAKVDCLYEGCAGWNLSNAAAG